MTAAPTTSIQVGPIRVDFLVEAERSGGSVTIFECSVPAGSRVPAPHSHDTFEETVYGLRGTCTWTVDGEVHTVGPGDVLRIRRGQVHGFENLSDEDLTFLAIASPGVFGPAYFRDVSAVLSAGGPPDPAAIGAAMRRHGLTPAPPAPIATA